MSPITGFVKISRYFRKAYCDFLPQEKERFFLWIPVFMGIGIAIYFGITEQPTLWLSLGGLFISGLTTYYLRNKGFVFLSTLIITLVFVGFSSAHIRTLQVGTHMLERPFGPASIQGRIVNLQETRTGLRVTLEDLQISRMRADLVPSRLRLHVRSQKTTLMTGDWVSGRGILKPPSPPSSPHGFDFQRHSYFNGIGAIGFAYGSLNVLSSPQAQQHNNQFSLTYFFDYLRASVQTRIHESFSKDDQNNRESLAITFLTGNKKVIPEDVLEDVRIAGLAHLLAISGLHIGLVSAMAFFSLRFILSLIPPVAERYPIKKWAACFAIMAALFFTLLTGGSIPTIRAFLMCAVVFVGVCLDRKAISLRTLAWAAILVLLVFPESLLGPSFQLSFAAVCALIAFYENRDPLDFKRSKIYRYFRDILLTSMIATIATLPFAAYHFNMVALYGIFSNLLAIPITVFWIMPFGLAALLAMPLGLEHLFLQIMGIGIEQLLWVAAVTAEQPYALISVPSIQTESLALLVLGGLMICLVKSPLRWGGAVCMSLGILLYSISPTPNILISSDGRLSAVHDPKVGIVMSSLRRASFIRDNWMDTWGETGSQATSHTESFPCDETGCLYSAPSGQKIVFNSHPMALWEDCQMADILIAPTLTAPKCDQAHAIIDWHSLYQNGSYAIYFEGDTIKVLHSRNIRGQRPWTIYSPPERP